MEALDNSMENAQNLKRSDKVALITGVTGQVRWYAARASDATKLCH